MGVHPSCCCADGRSNQGELLRDAGHYLSGGGHGRHEYHPDVSSGAHSGNRCPAGVGHTARTDHPDDCL